MRVLLLTDADVFAGTERHIFDLASALRDYHADEVAVQVGCPDPAPLAERCHASGIPVLKIPKQGFIDWNAVRVLSKSLAAGQLDIIHAHNGRTALAAALAVTQAKRGHLVTTQHFIEPNHAGQKGFKGKLSHVAHNGVAAKTSCVIAISQAVRQGMLRRHEVPDSKIKVVPNGIPDVAAQTPSNPNHTRATLQADGRPLLLCAARLETEKDIATLITAMREVAQAHPDALCLIAGQGSLQRELQAQIDRDNLGGNVRLLGFRDDVLALMKACDLFVLPSVAEPFGLVLIEAMAFGKPVVATCAGGPVEIVDPDRNGFLVPPSSPPELASALSKLLADKALRGRMGQASRARYEEFFSSKRMANEISAVYRRVSQS